MSETPEVSIQKYFYDERDNSLTILFLTLDMKISLHPDSSGLRQIPMKWPLLPIDQFSRSVSTSTIYQLLMAEIDNQRQLLQDTLTSNRAG